VANSVGGFLPGDDLLRTEGETPEQIAAHPHPFYTPIATFGSEYELQPVGYGLKFAGAFSGGMLLQTDFATQLRAAGVNASAYVAQLPGGETSVIILNKDAAVDVELELNLGRGTNGLLKTERLHALTLDSRDTRITTPAKVDALTQGKCIVTLPRGSGARLTTAPRPGSLT
jgi:hypothetical protein